MGESKARKLEKKQPPKGTTKGTPRGKSNVGKVKSSTKKKAVPASNKSGKLALKKGQKQQTNKRGQTMNGKEKKTKKVPSVDTLKITYCVPLLQILKKAPQRDLARALAAKGKGSSLAAASVVKKSKGGNKVNSKKDR